MSEAVRARASVARYPLGDATNRVNNSLNQPVDKHAKVADQEAASIRSVASAARSAAGGPRCRESHESTHSCADTPAAENQASASQTQHPRARAVQQSDPSKRVSQASQASTAASSNRSSGYNYKTQVGPWQLGKTLGKGSSARVRLCKHRLSGELAAVKIIPKKSAYLIQHGSLAALHKYDDSLPERIDGEMRVPLSIEREVAILKLVDHPNVMKVYDIWENRSEIYLVLEYVDQGDLFDFINSNGRLTEEGAMFYFRQIMSAMQYCHTFNICHRDLKPENILLNSKNQVKIADFGMAALHQSETHRLETACGSPHYAAPELLKNRAYRGDRADIWSMGVILYAILAASLPFDDPDIRVLLAKTKRGQYEMPEFLSLEAKDLIRRMLQVNPDIRISLKEMWRHPLILKYDYLDDLGGKGGQPLDIRRGFHYAPIRGNEIDMHLVRQLRSLWHMYEEQEIRQKLMDSSKNDQKLFYWLLHSYRQKQLENFLPELAQSPSDYHHLHEPVWRRRVSTCEFNRPSSRGTGRSVSKFTVISHVAETDAGTVKSYDPYNSDQPMRGDSEVSHAKIIVHRKNQASRGSGRDEETYVTQPSKASTRSGTRHTRGASQRTNATNRFASTSSPRNSMGSLHSSRQGTPYTRSAGRKKRAIDFSQASHAQKRSADSRPSKKGSRRQKHESGAAADGVPCPVPSRTEGRNRARAITIMDRARPKLKIVEPKDPRILVDEEVRSFSNSIAKDCDEAFTGSIMETDISGLPNLDDLPIGGRGSTPCSFSTGTPSIASPTGQANQAAWDTRPLPPLPPESPASISPSASERHEAAKGDQPARKSKFLGLLAKPVILQKHERRVVSAPAYPRDGQTSCRLPSISESVRESDAATQEASNKEASKTRIVSAPPMTPREHADAEGLDYLSRVGDTIRVVNSPTATSPVPAPLNVRKKVPEQQRHSSGADSSRSYMHGAVGGNSAALSAADSSQGSEATKKKKTSWFRRSHKDEMGQVSSVRTLTTQWTATTESTRPSTNDTDSTAPTAPTALTAPSVATGRTSSRESSLPAPTAAKRNLFGLLFWKNSKKQEARKRESLMSIAGPEYEESPFHDGQPSAHAKGGRGYQRSLVESDSEVRKIEVHQTWIARLFGVKPATSYMCLTISRRAARQEVTILLREWRQYGMRDVQVDKERNMVFARVSAKNYLSIKEVSLAIEIMTVIEHGKRGALSIVRFTQERGAASSFHKVVDTIKAVMGSRNLLVTDARKEKMMIKTLNS